jgi:hypothetical protein
MRSVRLPRARLLAGSVKKLGLFTQNAGAITPIGAHRLADQSLRHYHFQWLKNSGEFGRVTVRRSFATVLLLNILGNRPSTTAVSATRPLAVATSPS